MTRGGRRPALLAVASAAGAGALAVAAWPWLRGAVIEPVAIVAWLLLRLTVLSVDQRLWWLALVCAVPVTFLAATRARSRAAPRPLAGLAPPRHPVDRWRSAIASACEGEGEPLPYRWDPFVQVVVLHAALEQRVEPDHHVHAALRAGELPLPPAVHAFVFPPPPARPAGVRGAAARAAAAPRRWILRWTGRERARRRRAVAALLAFLEKSLELTRDDRRERPRR